MRLPLIAGNWKMNTTIAEAVALATEIRATIRGVYTTEVLVCPPFVSLAAVGGVLEGSSIRLGAQNLHYEDKGAFTGEVSPLMLAGLCRFVIIGHSERRQHFGDSDEVVNRKLAAALRAGLAPIVCVGEQLEENQAGRTEEVVVRQLEAALAGVSVSPDLVIAYEPIWAIGTGLTASGKAANQTAQLIRRTVAGLAGNEVADDVRVLYGGSVTADNIAEFMEQMDISGALVGGASLKAADFVSIAKQTEDIFFPNNPPTKDLIPW